jgi:para-aminobenzoate synthetase
MPINLLLIKNTYDPLTSFNLYFDLKGIKCHSIFYDQLKPMPYLAAYDGIILSGTDYPAVVSNLPLYDDEIDLIQSTAIPVLGICGGLHVICQAFGGGVGRLKQPVYGRTLVNYKLSERLFSGLPNPCTMFSRHLYYINTVPKGFITTAYSWPHGIVYGLRHHTRPLFGVQFHPERRNDGYLLLDNYTHFLQAEIGSHSA